METSGQNPAEAALPALDTAADCNSAKGLKRGYRDRPSSPEAPRPAKREKVDHEDDAGSAVVDQGSASLDLLPDELLLEAAGWLTASELAPLLPLSRRLFYLWSPLVWRGIHGCEHMVAHPAVALRLAPTIRQGSALPEDASAQRRRATLYARSVRAFTLVWDEQAPEGQRPPPPNVRDLATVLTRCEHIRRFELSNMGSYIPRVSKMLVSCLPNVTVMNLSGMSFETGPPAALAKILGSMPQIKSLGLMSVMLHKDSLYHVAQLDLPDLDEVRLFKCWDTERDMPLHFLGGTDYLIDERGLDAFVAKFAPQLSVFALENCREQAVWWGLSEGQITALAEAITPKDGQSSRMRSLRIDVSEVAAPASCISNVCEAMGPDAKELSFTFRQNVATAVLDATLTAMTVHTPNLESLHLMAWHCDGLAANQVLPKISSFPHLEALTICTFPPCFAEEELQLLTPLVDHGLKFLAISGFRELADSASFKDLADSFEAKGCAVRCRVVADARTMLLQAFVEMMQGLIEGSEPESSSEDEDDDE